MLINVLQPEECRIAIVEDGVLEELYIERASQESYVGNIYKGRIVNIEPSIQAAFVDFGIGRNGFLHVSDVDPAYYKHLLTKEQWEEYEQALLQEQEEPSAPPRRNGGRRGRSERPARDVSACSTPAAVVPPAPPSPPAVPTPPALGAEEDYEEEFAAGIIDEQASAPPVPPPVAPSPVAPPQEDEEDFAAGILDDQAASGAAGEQVPSVAVTSTPASDVAGPVAQVEPAATVTGTLDTREPAAEQGAPPPEAEADSAAAESTVEQTPAPVHPIVPVSELPDTSAVVTGVQPPLKETPAVAAAPEADEQPSSATTPAADTPEATAEQTPPSTSQSTDSPVATSPVVVDTSRSRRRRTSRTTTTAEPTTTTDPSAARTDTSEQTPARPRARRSRRKNASADPAAEASSSAASQEDSNKTQAQDDGTHPRYMEGAEHRTVPPDDEDIEPFYEGIEGFDPDVPNDRFNPEFSASSGAEEPLEPEAEGRLPAEPETAEQAEEEARELAHESWATPGVLGGDEGGVARTSRPRGRTADRRTSRSPTTTLASRNARDRGLPKPKIEQIFKRGQEVIVQVIKEAVGTKGPTLSTYISIAGRYLVLMPSLNRVGVSRKIEDPEARRRLRHMMNSLNPPKGVGFIVRTAAVDRDISELRSDLIYLLRLWQVVVRRIKRVPAPVEIYRESDMITRTIRDIFTSDIDTIWVDEPNAFAHASEFLQIVMPKFANRIRYYDSTEPLFYRYGLEEEIAKIYQKRIDLPQGGSIVIEQTEALVAIDVNSGNFRAENNNAEETAFQMNLLAAREIARQLRLRDLGGVIVNDFIDMRNENHRRKVEEALREALKRDRARTKILRISQFGIIEMTRQRIRPSIKRSLFADCPFCNGNGYVKTTETAAIEAMRLLQLAAHRAPPVATAQLTVQLDVAHYLLNKRRKEIAALEDRAKIVIQITGQPHVSPDTLIMRCFDHNGNEVPLHTRSTPRLSGGRIPNGLNRPRERRQLPPAD
ncbi:MAG: Rne/Rng family ribonuclease [Gemmataceae bacterium]|nr:Rne/Rng family ribonuclease [Gemmataceae bacterium]